MKNSILKVISAILTAVFLAGTVIAAPTPTINNQAKNTETKPAETTAEKTETTETKETESKSEKSPTDYTGQWVCNHATDTMDVKARITENTITVYIQFKNIDLGLWGDNAMFLYWSGTYTPPAKEGKHTWTSNTLISKDNKPLLASSDTTKAFTYENGKITFPMSLTFFGETASGTITLVPFVTDKVTKAELGYSVINVNENSLGELELHAITEIKNTGNTNLYLDYGTFYFLEDGVIIKEDNYVKGYPQIVKPGNSGYYCTMVSIDKPEKTAEYSLSVSLEAFTAYVEEIALESYDAKLKEDYFGDIHASVKVKNSFDAEITPTVVAILFDENENPIDVLEKEYEKIPAKSTKLIETYDWDNLRNLKLSDVATAKVFCYIPQNQNNLDW